MERESQSQDLGERHPVSIAGLRPYIHHQHHLLLTPTNSIYTPHSIITFILTPAHTSATLTMPSPPPPPRTALRRRCAPESRSEEVDAETVECCEEPTVGGESCEAKEAEEEEAAGT
jgi:hypothetical protein